MRNILVLIALMALLLAGLTLFKPRGDSVVHVPPLPTANSSSSRYDAERLARISAPARVTQDSSTNAAFTNAYKRFAYGDYPRPTRAQLEAFLSKNGRSVDALLGALRATDDEELLKEAKEKFPNDPRVQFAAAFKSQSPEERQQWLEKFKASDPENSLANYLLANEHLTAGRTEQALAELTAAGGKRSMENYLVDFIQNTEEAYRAAGYSDGEAKSIAGISALLPELAQLKGVGVGLADLAKRYREAGDEASAQAALQMGLNLAYRMDQSPQVTLIQELVGIAIERRMLDVMNPNAPYGLTGHTVKDQLDALTARRNAFKDLIKKTSPILESMSNEELGHYFDRIKIYGDYAALQWVARQSPQP